MTNNIHNVPRELLERAAYTLELAYEVDTPTVRDIRALLSAPSPAGVDGWDVAGDILEKLSDAQAIIDGLRGEVAEERAKVAQLEEGIPRIMEASYQFRQQRDKQAQRIGELEGLLRDCYPGCGLTARQTQIIRQRIDAALAAGKEGSDEYVP